MVACEKEFPYKYKNCRTQKLKQILQKYDCMEKNCESNERGVIHMKG